MEETRQTIHKTMVQCNMFFCRRVASKSYAGVPKAWLAWAWRSKCSPIREILYGRRRGWCTASRRPRPSRAALLKRFLTPTSRFPLVVYSLRSRASR